MPNPLSEYNRLLAGLGIHLPHNVGYEQQDTSPQLPELSPEEEESLLSQITGNVLGGVQYVGETLDKPGAALRGLLGGEPSALLNLIPFSDAMGITNPEERVSGRQLLERGGILDTNTPGLDMGDVAGFGAEVLLDPLNALSFGGAGALTAAGKAIQAADRAAAAAAKLAGKAAPAARLLEHAATPAQHIAEVAGKTMGLGAKAGEAITEAGAPLRGVVGFGLEGSPLGWLAKKAGVNPDTPFIGRNIVPEWATGEIPAAVLGKTYYGKYSPLRPMRQLFDTRVQEQRLGDAQRLSDIIEAEKIYYKADLAQTGMQLGKQFEEAKTLFDDLIKTSDDPMAFENMMRNFLEVKGDITPENVFDVVKNLNGTAEVGDIATAANEFHKLANHMRELDATTHEELLRFGLDINRLTDDYIEHFPRRITQEAKGELEIAGKKLVSKAFPFKEARDILYKNFPGGTPAVNMATSVGWGVGRRWNPEGADAAFEAIADTLPIARKITRSFSDTAWQAEVYKLADEMGLPRDQIKAATKDVFNVAKEQYQPIRATWDEAVERLKGRGISLPKIQAVIRKGGDYSDSSLTFFDEVADGLARDGHIGGSLDDASQSLWDMLTAGAPKPPTLRHAETLKQVRGLLEGQPYTRQFFKDAGEDTVKWGDHVFTRENLDQVAKDMMGDPEHAPIFWGMDENAFETPGSVLFDFLKDGGHVDLPEGAEALAGVAAKSTDKFQYTKKAFKNYLVQKHNLPAWWRTGELMQEQMARTPGYEWAKDIGYEEFAEKFKADWLTKNAATVPDPAILEELSNLRPDRFVESMAGDMLEVNVLAPSDLDKLVERLENMPVEMLSNGLKYPPLDSKAEAQAMLRTLYAQHPGAEFAIIKEGDKWTVTRPAGLFNRSTLTDQMDYLQHAAKVQWGLQGVHRMFSDPAIATQVKPGEIPKYTLAQAWQDMKLTDLGLLNLMQKRGAQFATDPESVKTLGDSLTQAMRAAEQIEVPQEVVQAATRFMKAHTQPESISGLLGVIDRFMSAFKGGVTIPFPAFHVRNFISGQYANWQSGQWSAESIAKAMKLAKGKPVEIAGMDGVEMMREMNAYGLLENDFLTEIAAAGNEAGQAMKLPSVLKTLKDSLKTGEGYNPLAMRGGPTFKGVLEKGKTLDERIGIFTTARETSGFAPLKAGEAAYKKVEFYNRVAPYIALRDAGLSAAEAAQKVKAAQFDYSQFTHFERSVMKRLIPFYAYGRKNLPFQLRQLIEHPGGRTAQTIRGYNVAREESEDAGGYVPRYLAESLSIGMGGDANNQKFLSVSGLLPFEEALNRFAFNGGVPDVTRTLQKLGGQLNPAIQWPIEAMTDTQLWSGRKRSNLYQEPTPFPMLNHMLYSGAVPYTARATSTLRPFFDERKSTGQALFNAAVGGLKITDVDAASRMLEARDILQRSMPSEAGVGTFSRLFPKDISRMSPDTAMKMAAYNSITSKLAAIKKKRDKEKGK